MGQDEATDRRAAAICAAFGLGALSRWTPSRGTRNQALVLETSSGKWYARHRHTAYSDAARIRFDHAVARHLAERGTPVAVPRDTVGGNGWWQENDAVWEVFPYVSGRLMREGNARDVAALGRALARWHVAGRDFPMRLDKLGMRGETDPEGLLERAGQLAGVSAGCTEAVAPYRAWVERAAARLPDSRFGALPACIVHGDVQPGNILLDKGEVAAFIDLDWCAWRPRIYDLAFAIPFCCATHEQPFDSGDIWSLTQPARVDHALCQAFLRAYESDAPALSQDERGALPAQIVLSWCHSRILGAFKIPEGDRAAFLARPPHAMEPLLPGMEGAWKGAYE